MLIAKWIRLARQEDICGKVHMQIIGVHTRLFVYFVLSTNIASDVVLQMKRSGSLFDCEGN